ncbi:MAG: polysaccharide deacetylase family protein [Flexilinea sp.]
MKPNFFKKKFIVIAAAICFVFSNFQIAFSAAITDDENRIQNIVSEFSTLTKKAEIVKEQEILDSKISLVFEGSASITAIEKIIEILQKYGVTASFFLPGISVSETPEIARSIALAGYEIGNYSLDGEKEMDKLPVEQMVRNLFSTQKTIQYAAALTPVMVRFNGSEYTEDLLTAAKACGLDYAVKPSAYLNYKSFSTKEQTDGYVRKTGWGSIISVKINQELDENEFIDQLKDLQEEPAVDPDPSIRVEEQDQKTEPESTLMLDQEVRLVEMVDLLIGSYIDAGFEFVSPLNLKDFFDPEITVDFNARRIEKPELTNIFKTAFTTQPAVAITFSQLGKNDEEIYSLLDSLDALNIKATFFVTGNEAVYRKPLIQEIIQRGHSIENGGFAGKITTEMKYNDICKEILKGKKYLFQEFGVISRFFRSPSNNTSDIVREAADNLGIILTAYDKNPPIEEGDTIEGIMQYFKWGFNRGNILFFTTNEYEDMPNLLAAIADQVRATGYDFTTIGTLYDGQYEKTPLEEIEGWDAVKVNPNYDPDGLISGSYFEMIGTQEKVVFLSFDDWGSDKTINRILEILKEKNIKASFFVIAHGAESNPNLLRTIDEAGHDVCCHSYSHDPNFVEMGSEFIQEDVVKCFQVLTEAIGHKIPLLFRFPRQESDKKTVNSILATGFKSIIQASISTGDYQYSKDVVSKYVSSLAGKGKIIIMHLTDNASGVEALPMVIEHLRARGYSFAKLSDYLESK